MSEGNKVIPKFCWPSNPQVWEGLNVVKTGRVMLGETDPVSKYLILLI